MKRNSYHHPKFKFAGKILGTTATHAWGMFAKLCGLTGEFAPRGDIGRWTNAYIAEQAEWDGDPDTFVDAYITAQLIDRSERYRLTIHDWREECENWVHGILANKRLHFCDGLPASIKKFNIDDREPIQEDYSARRGMSRDVPIPNDDGKPIYPNVWHIFWARWPRHHKANKSYAIASWNSWVIEGEHVAQDILEGQRLHLQPGGNLHDLPAKPAVYARTWLNQRRWEEPFLPTETVRKTRAPKAAPAPAAADTFEAFWALYPKKDKRKPAAAWWATHVKTAERAAEIIAGVHTHLQPGGVLANPEPRFIPAAPAWLNQERWHDEYKPSAQALENAIFERQPTLADLMGD